jgi:hypothetical protein
MYLKAEDSGAADYLVIDLDTNKPIDMCMEANDETGEITIAQMVIVPLKTKKNIKIVKKADYVAPQEDVSK